MTAGFRPRNRWQRAVLVVTGVCLLVLAGQVGGAEPEPPDGFWPTPRMVELLVERLIDDTALRFGLDERQRALFRERFEKVLPALLEKHRAVLRPLMTDIIIQHLSGEVPMPEEVAGWAGKGLPIVREAMAQWDRVYQGMRPHLRPDQRAKWGREHFVFKLGYALAEAKLRGFAEGRFDPREWHTPLPGPHQPKKHILTQAERAGMQTRRPPDLVDSVITGIGRQAIGPPRPAAPGWQGHPAQRPSARFGKPYLPLDKWERYTQQFIRRFGLDQGQRTSAMAILKEMRQRASDYRGRRSRELARVRASLRKAKGDARDRLKAELAELERPARQLFDEFRSRLDRLLTESQRTLSGADRADP